MRSILVLTAVAAVAAWVLVHQLPGSEAEAEPAMVRAQEVQSVAIDGRGLPLAALRAVLATHAGDLLDAKRLEQDRSSLEGELAARGYLAARVEPAAVTFGSNGGAFVSFAVVQGPVFHFRSITVTGATERDAGVVTLVAGDEALGTRIERARQTLSDTLARRGKASAVTVALHPDAVAAVVDVELSTR